MAPLDGGIVLHPFGRQCIGYKSAGAIDVLHAIEAVKEQVSAIPLRKGSVTTGCHHALV